MDSEIFVNASVNESAEISVFFSPQNVEALPAVGTLDLDREDGIAMHLAPCQKPCVLSAEGGLEGPELQRPGQVGSCPSVDRVGVKASSWVSGSSSELSAVAA